jgi:hypothetical protein
MNEIKNLKVNHSVTIGQWVIKRVSRKEYRLAELMGDWIMSGTAKEIESRIS